MYGTSFTDIIDIDKIFPRVPERKDIRPMIPPHGSRYDLFFLDPDRYVQEMRNTNECNAIFRVMHINKLIGIDRDWTIPKFMELHFGDRHWRAYRMNEGTATEFSYQSTKYTGLVGVYPLWNINKDTLTLLKEFVENPWGSREDLQQDKTLYEYTRPVWHQPHRVFVTGIKNILGDPVMANKVKKLRQMQLFYPEVELVISWTNSFTTLFGMDFLAGCYDPFDMAVKKNVTTPSGRRVMIRESIDEVSDIRKWEANALGFTERSLKDLRTRIEYNILAARYAAHHWSDDTGLSKRFKKYNRNTAIVTTPGIEASEIFSAKYKSRFPERLVKFNDKVDCDKCSLWRACISYKRGSVCNLPGTESRKLSEMAMSRDAGVIVDMLASIVAKQVDRVEDALELEEGLDPQINKMLNDVFKNGVQLAKLRDPGLSGGSKIQVNQINGSSTEAINSVSNADPRMLVSSIVTQIEAKGIDRKDITEEMISKALQENNVAIVNNDEVFDAEVME